MGELTHNGSAAPGAYAFLRLKLDLRHAVRLSLQLTSETGHVTVETARFDRPSLRGLGRMQPWPADPRRPPHMYGRDAPSFGSGTAWARTLDWHDEHMCEAGTELLVAVRGRGEYHPYVAGARDEAPFPPPAGSSYALRVHAALEYAGFRP